MVQSLGRVENYFKLNRILLSSVGFWPYQTPRTRRLAITSILFLIITQLIPQLAGLYTARKDFDKVMECLSPLGCVALFVIKLFNLMMNNDKMKDLLMIIQRDFDSAISEPEMKIIQRYAKNGIQLTKIYAITLYSAWFIFVIPSLLQGLTSTIIGTTEMNATVSHEKLPLIMEYIVNLDEYFYWIWSHICLSTLLTIAVIIAADGMYVIHAKHGIAKFMLLKYRLSQITVSGKIDVDIHCHAEIDDLVYQNVINCVHVHNEAIGYANAVESTYTVCQFFQVGLICLLLSTIGLHATTKLKNPDELLRLFGMTFSIMLQLSFYSWPSHELMDQSANVCEAVYSTEWYLVSIRTRKLLLQMMTRSLRICEITAGKIWRMSMENYCKILSNSVSYFTVLSTMREQSKVTE